jgi:hypothetical protein
VQDVAIDSAERVAKGRRPRLRGTPGRLWSRSVGGGSGPQRSMKIQGPVSGVLSHVTAVPGQTTAGEGSRATDRPRRWGGASGGAVACGGQRQSPCCGWSRPRPRTSTDRCCRCASPPDIQPTMKRRGDGAHPILTSPPTGPRVRGMERARACQSWKIGDCRADFPPAAGGARRLRKMTARPAGFPRNACSRAAAADDVSQVAGRGNRDMHSVTNSRGARRSSHFGGQACRGDKPRRPIAVCHLMHVSRSFR